MNGVVSIENTKQEVDVSIRFKEVWLSFQIRSKPISNGDDWLLKVICGLYNHASSETLVGCPYARKLKSDEHALLVDMMKSQVRPTNILLTLKENNVDNVTTIKQLYNARYTYKRSVRGPRTEMQ